MKWAELIEFSSHGCWILHIIAWEMSQTDLVLCGWRVRVILHSGCLGILVKRFSPSCERISCWNNKWGTLKDFYSQNCFSCSPCEHGSVKLSITQLWSSKAEWPFKITEAKFWSKTLSFILTSWRQNTWTLNVGISSSSMRKFTLLNAMNALLDLENKWRWIVTSDSSEEVFGNIQSSVKTKKKISL